MRKRILFIFLLLVIVGNILLSLFINRESVFQKFNFSYWSYRYSHSQWVVPQFSCSITNPHINPYTCKWDDNWFVKHPTFDKALVQLPIGDDGLYMYAGAAYMKGADPSLLNAEIPPFGKYVLGFVETIFHYSGIFNVFFACLALVLYFVFNRLLFKSTIWALLPVLFFSFETLFLGQLKGSYMDTMFLSLLFLTFIFFLKKKYIWSGIFLGLFMATKAPFLIALIGAVFIVYYLLQKQILAHLKQLLVLFLIACLVFVATYARTFLLGHSLGYFIQVQKYIMHFYMTGAKGILGAVMPMLLWGQWYTWFSPAQKVSEWSFLWPVGLLGTLSTLYFWLKNKDSLVLFQLLWVGFYLAFLCITPIFSRYLLLLLPFMYNLTIWSFCELIKKKSS